MHRRARCPFAVAVPLEDVDLAVGQWVLVDAPERGPQAGNRQSSLIFASQVWLIMLRKLPRSLPV